MASEIPKEFLVRKVGKRKLPTALITRPELETAIQAAICDYLALRKHFFWRANTTPTYDATRGVYRSMPKYAKKGVPDIIVIRQGRFIGLEVKTRTNRQSPDQILFQQEVAAAGGDYQVVHSVDEVIALGL